MAKTRASRKFQKDISNFINKIGVLPAAVKKDLILIDFSGLLRKTHDAERDPFGRPWKERKDDLPHKILTLSGKLRRSYRKKLVRNTLSIFNTAPYANTHNYGDPSRNIPARMIIPPSGKVPPLWFNAIELQFSKTIKALNKKTIKTMRG